MPKISLKRAYILFSKTLNLFKNTFRIGFYRFIELRKECWNCTQLSLSDHYTNHCEFSFSSNASTRASHWRINLTLLQNSQFCAQFKSGFTEFMGFNKDSVTDVRFVWNAIKGYIRNNCTLFCLV